MRGGRHCPDIHDLADTDTVTVAAFARSGSPDETKVCSTYLGGDLCDCRWGCSTYRAVDRLSDLATSSCDHSSGCGWFDVSSSGLRARSSESSTGNSWAASG